MLLLWVPRRGRVESGNARKAVESLMPRIMEESQLGRSLGPLVKTCAIGKTQVLQMWAKSVQRGLCSESFFGGPASR